MRKNTVPVWFQLPPSAGALQVKSNRYSAPPEHQIRAHVLRDPIESKWLTHSRHPRYTPFLDELSWRPAYSARATQWLKMTFSSTDDLDIKSDALIAILVDHERTRIERTRATQQLYQRHASWVVQQVGKKIYNPDDIQDIAQTVWMQVLQPDKLSAEYKNLNGKFRAYLRAPIRWAILKHIDKLPFTTNDAGKKTPAQFVDINESILEECLDKSILDEVIENIIKPNLKFVDIKSRNVYVANEFDVIFEIQPSLAEVATINGIDDSEALRLFTHAARIAIDACSDEEISIYLPVNYKALVDPAMLSKSSGRYLATLMGISEVAFRKRLYRARQYLLETVRQNLFTLTEGSNHG